MAILEQGEVVAEPNKPVGVIWLHARRIGTHYLTRRILRAIATIFLVATLTFFLVRLMPGDPIEVYVSDLVINQGVPRPTAVQMAASLFNIDLNAPVYQQYFSYLGSLAHGDLGNSLIQQGVPVSEIILHFLPWTLFAVGIGLIISFSIGMLLGIAAAYKRESIFDHFFSNAFAILQAFPDFLLGLLVLVYVGVQWKLFSITGIRGTLSPGVHPGLNLEFIRDAFYHAALPIAIYFISTLGGWMLAMRSSTESALNDDYVTVAKARGIKPRRIALAYVGRNASLPLFTQLTLAMATTIGGSILIERIFQYQGVGLTLSTAINQRDYPLIQGILLIISIAVVFGNLAADLVYTLIDPRVRVSGEK